MHNDLLRAKIKKQKREEKKQGEVTVIKNMTKFNMHEYNLSSFQIPTLEISKLIKTA